MMEIEKILFDEQAIARTVRSLAGRIAADYAGKELVLIGVLKGAVMFTVDLMRGLPFSVMVDFVHASSYGMSTVSSREIRISKDIETDITGRHVLLVDCIIDTGETMNFLFKHYGERKPASLQAVVLLDKRVRRTVPVPLAYSGFEIPDVFVAGYGMDCREQCRNLPCIAVVKI